jgi:hypothetical protein
MWLIDNNCYKMLPWLLVFQVHMLIFSYHKIHSTHYKNWILSPWRTEECKPRTYISVRMFFASCNQQAHPYHITSSEIKGLQRYITNHSVPSWLRLSIYIFHYLPLVIASYMCTIQRDNPPHAYLFPSMVA